MGFSRGGQAALYSSLKRFQKMHGPAADLTFAAYIALYPTCNTSFREDEDVTGPIRILHGAADNYVPVGPCKTYVERLAKAGRDVKLVEYPDAYHVFDGPAFRKPIVVDAAQTTRQCSMSEDAQGQILNRDTQKPFTYSDVCVQKGVTIAFNEAANAQARAYVREFLAERFGLKK
jgi:dienelactone hydrolase